MGHPKTTAILIAETGADWGDWLDALHADADEVAVVLQQPEEAPSAFASRVRTRLDALCQDGRLVAAALAGSEVHDGETLGARARVVQAAVSRMIPMGGGRVYLDAPAEGRGRLAMMALASVVEEQVGLTGVDVITPVALPTAA